MNRRFWINSISQGFFFATLLGFLGYFTDSMGTPLATAAWWWTGGLVSYCVLAAFFVGVQAAQRKR